MDWAKYNIQRQTSEENIKKLHESFNKLTNRQLIQVIQWSKDNNTDRCIYKNIYQFVKLYIVTTGRFVDWLKTKIHPKLMHWLQGTPFSFLFVYLFIYLYVCENCVKTGINKLIKMQMQTFSHN